MQHNHKVLIVDDDPFITQGLRALMEGNKIDVIVTDKAEDIESLLAAHNFSLFLVDLRLSGVDGIEGLEVIRYCREKQPDSNIILMTAYGSEDIKKTAFDLGVKEYFEKPIEIPRLVETVRELGVPIPLIKKAERPEKGNGNRPHRNIRPLKKILIVEDSDLLQRMYTMVFRRYTTEGCQLIQAKNGREGLEALAKHPDTEVIVLDINMPVMNGLEFLTSDLRRENFTHIPVVVVSTEGHEEDAKRALKEGARNYVTKPFKPQALLQIVEDMF